MLSRRNIRIKILQTLYGTQIQEQSVEKALTIYRQSIDRSVQILVYNIRFLQKVIFYAIKDKEIRSLKNLPTESDKLFEAHLYNNPLSKNLLSSISVEKYCKKWGIDAKIDLDLVQKLYYAFAKTEAYVDYSTKSENNLEDHLKILLGISKSLLKDESYIEAIEDHYPSWEDDESLIVGSMKKIIKNLNSEDDILSSFMPDDETVIEFGETLLKACFQHEKAVLEIIKPMLENWDIERVATIDLLMIRMAVTEFQIFDNIPTNVTLNEFVEISKQYSTDKSKEFVNGLLDKIVKKIGKSI